MTSPVGKARFWKVTWCSQVCDSGVPRSAVVDLLQANNREQDMHRLRLSNIFTAFTKA